MRFRERLSNALITAAISAKGERIGAAIVSASTAFAGELITNRYEAAQPNSPKRSYIPAFNRDARYDANSYSRWEMTRKMRYFQRNVWLVQAMQDEHVKWTVGANGLQIRPMSKDVEWNKRMQASYKKWCLSPTVDNTITMAQVHRQISATDHLENDVFILKTFIKLPNSPSRPAIQIIESHRCSAPGTVYTAEESDDIVDGVQLRRVGKKVQGVLGYWMIDNLLMDEWVFQSADDIIHVFDPDRTGMYRGITPYHAVMNTLHDLDDMEGYEMERAKSNSSITNIITTPSGEINSDAMRQRRYGFGSYTTNADTKDDNTDVMIQLYRKVLGAKTVALKTGETMQQFGNETPSASTQWYWKYKIAQICKAGKVPIILILPEILDGLQGTTVRGIYDSAAETFRGQFFRYAQAAGQMYLYYANWARYNDPSVVDAPADWDTYMIVPPKAVNVDVGYTSAANLAELAAGVQSFDEIAARSGRTSGEVLEAKAKDAALINKLAKQYDVTPGEISSPAGQAQLLAMQSQNQDQDDPPEPGDDSDNNDPPQPKKKKAVATN